MRRFLLLATLLVAAPLAGQAVVVTDSTEWLHAVAVGTRFDSTRMTLAPGDTVSLRYLMRDVRVHPPIDLSAGPGIWSTSDSAFTVTGTGSDALLALAPGAVAGDSARVFLTLSSPRATKVVPEIGAFLFVDNPGVYECRGVSYPNLALWGFGDLTVHFRDGPRSFDCQPAAPAWTHEIQIEFAGPWNNGNYGLRVRVTDAATGTPATTTPAIEILSGAWGDGSTATRACTTGPDGCGPGDVKPGTVVRVTLDGAAAVERTAGG